MRKTGMKPLDARLYQISGVNFTNISHSAFTCLGFFSFLSRNIYSSFFLGGGAWDGKVHTLQKLGLNLSCLQNRSCITVGEIVV